MLNVESGADWPTAVATVVGAVITAAMAYLLAWQARTPRTPPTSPQEQETTAHQVDHDGEGPPAQAQPKQLVRSVGAPEFRKIVAWIVIGYFIFFVAFRPHSAASIIKMLGAGLVDLTTGFIEFFTELVSLAII